MTKKRFKVTDNTNNPYLSDWSVTDYADGGIVDHPMTSENMANVICDLLNDLEEARAYYQENFLTMKTERNQLKEENKKLQEEIIKYLLCVVRNECSVPINKSVLGSVEYIKERYND